LQLDIAAQLPACHICCPFAHALPIRPIGEGYLGCADELVFRVEQIIPAARAVEIAIVIILLQLAGNGDGGVGADGAWPLRGVGDVGSPCGAIEPRGEARIAGHVAACVIGIGARALGGTHHVRRIERAGEAA
jgi:hypothetical protein